VIARWLAYALCAAGLAGGIAFDSSAPRPIEERAGFRVVSGDFHMHTRFSDGVLSPCDLVLLGRRRGLDVIAVTEHNSVFPSQLARACATLVADAPLVITGEEVTTLELHLLALGIERDVDARAAPIDIADAVHQQGGVVIAAHPTRRYHDALALMCDELDGVEVVHPLAFRARQGANQEALRGDSGIVAWSDMVAFARGPCGNDKAMIGNSDYHAGSVLGIVRTHVFVDEVSASGVLDAIRDRRTVTIAPDGTVFGREDLVASLAAAPLAERETDYGYQAAGWIDRASRVLGLLGFVILFVIGWRHNSSKQA
jgi:hypothetical protein